MARSTAVEALRAEFAPLIKALQEQDTARRVEVDSLRDRCAALEKKVAAILAAAPGGPRPLTPVAIAALDATLATANALAVAATADHRAAKTGRPVEAPRWIKGEEQRTAWCAAFAAAKAEAAKLGRKTFVVPWPPQG